MIDSRRLDDLHPKVKSLALAFRGACVLAGYDIIFTSTLRDNECQAKLYAMGRTTKGPNPRLLKPMGDIVTKAKPGDSFHNYGVAFDFAVIVAGKAMWNDKAAFAACGEIWKSLGPGCEWAGDWKSFTETAHCQYTGGLTLADFKAGKRLGE